MNRPVPTDTPRPPRSLALKRDGREWWATVVSEYAMDEVQLGYLGLACQTLDLAMAARVRGDERTYIAHLKIFRALCRDMGLTLEPTRAGPGRPFDFERSRRA